jgi:hypothetical protein
MPTRRPDQLFARLSRYNTLRGYAYIERITNEFTVFTEIVLSKVHRMSNAANRAIEKHLGP